jgi:hypothetical protein
LQGSNILSNSKVGLNGIDHMSENGIKTHIIELCVHRGCVVIYTQQKNLITGTKRYVVYGIKRDTDYGIGVCLETVDVNKYYLECEKGTIKYI